MNDEGEEDTQKTINLTIPTASVHSPLFKKINHLVEQKRSEGRQVTTAPFLPFKKADEASHSHQEDMGLHVDEKVDRLLTDLYYKPSSPVSFSAPEKLYHAAKKKNMFVTLKEVRHWLSRQDTYTSFRQNNQHIPRRKVVVRGIRHQFQADLMDMSAIKSKNDGYKFLLTVIDCFSRLAAVVPLKSKHAVNVLQGMKVAFEHIGYPDKLQTDQGKEFWNYQMKRYLEEKGIILFYTDQELKAQMVERFNRTIREKIKKYMRANQTLRYVDVLPRLVQSYNTSPHGGLHGFAPVQVSKDNEKEIFDLQYGEYLSENKKHHRYKIGDIVKAAASKAGPLVKDKPTFESEPFMIVDCIHSNPPTYKLKRLWSNTVVQGVYYESQLQKVWKKKEPKEKEEKK